MLDEDRPWTAVEDEILMTARSDFPVTTFELISQVLTARGFPRTRNACVGRWNRIEFDDERDVRMAMVQAERRERDKLERIRPPDLEMQLAVQQVERVNSRLYVPSVDLKPVKAVPPRPPAPDPIPEPCVVAKPRKIYYRKSWTE